MSRYSIKDMEMLSNVKAHTIRIWEQRYDLFTPERTDTNIRYYTDEHLRRLLNVRTLMDAGMKISKVSRLSNEQIAGEIDKMLLGQAIKNAGTEAMVSQAIAAISGYDQELFEKVFSESVLHFGLTNAYLNVIYPMLIRIGMMWSKEDIIPAQEHFLSNLIKQKLFAAIDALPQAPKPAPLWVLYLSEAEKHEIGLLFAWYILRQQKQNVIYLGQEVPYENLRNVVEQCKPSYIYTFFVRKQPRKNIDEYLNRIHADLVDSTICISGSEELLDWIPEKGISVWVKDIQTLIALTNTKAHA